MAQKSLKILLYPVAIEPCEEGGYFVSCPVLQGCHAEGETIEEAIDNLKDIIKIVSEYKQKHIKKFSFPKVSIEKKKMLGELNLAVAQ